MKKQGKLIRISEQGKKNLALAVAHSGKPQMEVADEAMEDIRKKKESNGK